jgi:hypothetical protein
VSRGAPQRSAAAARPYHNQDLRGLYASRRLTGGDFPVFAFCNIPSLQVVLRTARGRAEAANQTPDAHPHLTGASVLAAHVSRSRLSASAGIADLMVQQAGRARGCLGFGVGEREQARKRQGACHGVAWLQLVDLHRIGKFSLSCCDRPPPPCVCTYARLLTHDSKGATGRQRSCSDSRPSRACFVRLHFMPLTEHIGRKASQWSTSAPPPLNVSRGSAAARQPQCANSRNGIQEADHSPAVCVVRGDFRIAEGRVGGLRPGRD